MTTLTIDTPEMLQEVRIYFGKPIEISENEIVCKVGISLSHEEDNLFEFDRDQSKSYWSLPVSWTPDDIKNWDAFHAWAQEKLNGESEVSGHLFPEGIQFTAIQFTRKDGTTGDGMDNLAISPKAKFARKGTGSKSSTINTASRMKFQKSTPAAVAAAAF